MARVSGLHRNLVWRYRQSQLIWFRRCKWLSGFHVAFICLRRSTLTCKSKKNPTFADTSELNSPRKLVHRQILHASLVAWTKRLLLFFYVTWIYAHLGVHSQVSGNESNTITHIWDVLSNLYVVLFLVHTIKPPTV